MVTLSVLQSLFSSLSFLLSVISCQWQLLDIIIESIDFTVHCLSNRLFFSLHKHLLLLHSPRRRSMYFLWPLINWLTVSPTNYIISWTNIHLDASLSLLLLLLSLSQLAVAYNLVTLPTSLSSSSFSSSSSSFHPNSMTFFRPCKWSDCPSFHRWFSWTEIERGQERGKMFYLIKATVVVSISLPMCMLRVAFFLSVSF